MLIYVSRGHQEIVTAAAFATREVKKSLTYFCSIHKERRKRWRGQNLAWLVAEWNGGEVFESVRTYARHLERNEVSGTNPAGNGTAGRLRCANGKAGIGHMTLRAHC